VRDRDPADALHGRAHDGTPAERIPAERIPVYEPWTTEGDARAVADAVLRGDLALGPEVEELEARFAARCGATEAIAVANGTVALELALRALGVGPGDEVVCTSLTIISCAIAIERVGARPVFVDVDPSLWVSLRAHVEPAITARTRAILAVHLFGHPFDPELRDLADAHGLALVEDAAQAHGSELARDGAWQPAGSLGDVATFSLYANKAITSGEGGLCVTRSPALAARLRALRNLCFTPERRFLHRELGTNARLSNVAASLALSQLSRLELAIERKRSVHAAYAERLAELPEVRLQAVAPWARPVPWMAALALEPGAPSAAEVLASLARDGVEGRPFFVGLHQQPALAHHDRTSLPETERLAERGLYLPSSPLLDEARIDRACDALRRALGRAPAPATRGDRSARGDEEAPFGEPYARLYDALYAAKPYAAEVDALLGVAARAGVTAESVLDLGCGSGRHLAAFAARGLETAGSDPSRAMLARARARVPEASLQHARAESTRFGRTFDLVTLLFAVPSYVTDDAELVRTLRTARAHLAPGGLLLAEVWYGPAVLAEPPEDRATTVEIDGVAYVRRASARHDELGQRVEIDYAITRRDGPPEEPTSRERHVLRYFFPRELDRLLRAAGLSILRLGAFPDGARLAPRPSSYSALVVARAA
jgi:perosamine synthetase